MKNKARKLLEAFGEFVGALVFFAVVVAMAWLCCAVSGYHWE